ncbi:integral membrane sensor signal transduction histidine kinase [Exiguobacterium sibiricum 255-15]|uniref:histidine kinase n=2 Tax=Exiguobacterium artemiae TaxID=340145 RepID=B1YMJ3_EXIS2|nr:integral membrane sensor signal transduction histidine kinase [Exiguobacterium sibiricum 255-15]
MGRRMKLQQVIIENFVLLLVSALLTLFLIIYAFVQSNLYDNAVESAQKLSREAQLYTMSYLENEQADSLAESAIPVASYLASRFDVRIQLFGSKSELLADSERDQLPLLASDIDQALKGTQSYLFLKENEAPVLFFSSPIYDETDIVGSIRFLVDLKPEADLLRKLTYVFSGVFLILLGLAVVTARRMSRTIIEPIDDLRSVSHALTKGYYANKLPEYPYEELNRLAADFASLADAVQHNIRQLEHERSEQQLFIDQVTHELRTPMTAIMGYVDLIPKLEAEEAARCYQYIETESRRLLRLVSDNLENAKQKRMNGQIASTMFDIEALIQDSLFIMKLRMDQHGIKVLLNLSQLFVLGQPDQTKQVVLNVLENAVKYSDAMVLNISSFVIDESLHLRIEDDGIGIDPHVLREFSLGVDSLKSAGGNGLGLLLCRQLMNEQGGRFLVDSDENGTKVEMIFRLADQTKKY